MPTFILAAGVTISITAKVEAPTLEEAKAKAEVLDMPSLCHHCTQSEPETWQVDELDGEPQDIEGEIL